MTEARPFPIYEKRINDGIPDGFTRCTCWCESWLYAIPEEWVWEGRTASCGANCQPRAA